MNGYVQETWLRFNGTAHTKPFGWQLNPNDDQNVQIDFDEDDVLVAGQRTLIKKGAVAIRLIVPAGSIAKTSPQIPSTIACVGGKSRCLGGIEFCCTKEAVGHCNGLWDLC